MLPPGSAGIPLLWAAGAGRSEQLRLRAVGSGWSAPFSLNTSTGQEAHIALPTTSGSLWLVRLEVAVRTLGVATVTLSRAGRAPVLLHNCTPVSMRYRQVEMLQPPSRNHSGAINLFPPEPPPAAPIWRPLPAHSATPYSWERPLDAHIIEVQAIGAGSALYRMRAGPAPVQVGSGGSVSISVRSAAAAASANGLEHLAPLPLPVEPGWCAATLSDEGGCAVLRLSAGSLGAPPGGGGSGGGGGPSSFSGPNSSGGSSIPRQVDPQSAPPWAAGAAAWADGAAGGAGHESEGGTEWHFALHVPDLFLSLMDHLPEEILCVTVQGLALERSVGIAGGGLTHTALRVARCQVDDMMPFTYFPVALFVRQPLEAPEAPDPFLQVAITEKRTADGRVRVYPYIRIKLTNGEVCVRLHEMSLWRVVGAWQRLRPGRLSAGGAEGGAVGAGSSNSRGVRVDMPMQVGLLSLSDMAIRFSFRTAPDSRPPGYGGAMQGLGLTLANLDETQLELAPFVAEGLHTRESVFWRQLHTNFTRQLRGQVLRLLQGVDVLDNVSHALTQASAGVAALSFDKKFMQRRRAAVAEEKRVSTISDGLRDGSELLARSLVRGFTGVFTKPVEGMREEGVEGFLKGVGRGILGIATQPMSGVLDFVSSTTEGLSASWDSMAAALSDESKQERRRLPRAVAGDGVVRPYDYYEAAGQQILRLAQRGVYFGRGVDIFRSRGKYRTDAYETHLGVPGRRIVMLTNRRLLMLSMPEGDDTDLMREPCVADWSVEWTDLMTMELLRVQGDPPTYPPAALVIHLKRYSRDRRIFDRRELKRVIYCAPGAAPGGEGQKPVAVDITVILSVAGTLPSRRNNSLILLFSWPHSSVRVQAPRKLRSSERLC